MSENRFGLGLNPDFIAMALHLMQTHLNLFADFFQINHKFLKSLQVKPRKAAETFNYRIFTRANFNARLAITFPSIF